MSRGTGTAGRSVRAIIKAALVCLAAALFVIVEKPADSYISARIVAAAAGILCAIASCLRTLRGGTVKAVRGRGSRALLLAGAVLFALVSPLGDYRAYWHQGTGGFLKMALCAVTGFLIAQEILFELARLAIKAGDGKALTASNKRERGRLVFAVIFFVLAAIYLIHLFAAGYPGYLTHDSTVQIRQAMRGAYTNHHPFWHTMLIKLCLSAGFALFGNITAGVAIYSAAQSLFMAAAFAYLIMTLYEEGVPRVFTALAAVGCATLPYHIFFSATMWKDVPFALCATVFLAALWRLMSGLDHRRLTYVLLGISAVGFGIMRSNGWLALLVTFMAACAVLGRSGRRALFVVAAALVISFILKNPVINALNIPQPDITESLSIPLQQISRVVTDGELTDEEREELSLYMNVDEIPDLYKPWISDPVKYRIAETGQSAYLGEHLGDFIKLWFKIGRHNLKLYLCAWSDQTKGYWNAGYDYWIWSVEKIAKNDYGLAIDEARPLRQAALTYGERFYDSPLLKPLHAIGLCIWIITAAFIAGCAARRREALLAVPVLAVFLTLLVATPVYCEFRYIYAAFTAIPLILGAVFFSTGSPASR